MRAHTDSQARRRIDQLLQSMLFGALTLSGTAFGAPTAAQDAAAQDAAGQAQGTTLGKTTYRVVNLSPDDIIGTVAINASGQVIYSYSANVREEVPSAWFYDGSTSRNIGRLGNDYAVTTGLNNAGQVVGQSRNAAGQTRSFIWSKRRPITDLGTLPGTTDALEPVINNNGVVTGYMIALGGVNRSYRWSAAGGLTDLGELAPNPSFSATYARALNDAGTIVGNGWAFGSDYHAFRWSFGSGIVDIHTLPAANDSTPVGIDARGNVAGNYGDDEWGDGSSRAFIWTRAGGMRDLVPGLPSPWVTGMTASGRVIGVLNKGGNNFNAVTWTSNGGLVDLGTLGGYFSSPGAANNKGLVVGASIVPGENQGRAFVWSAKDGMIDLNTRLRHAPPGLFLNNAVAVSDNGAIVAYSNSGLVLLKPVTGGACSCPHTVGPIVASTLVAVGAPLDVTVNVAGENPAARHGVTWSWGDGNSERVAAQRQAGQARNGAASASARHSYTAPGVYTVTADVADAGGNSVKVSRKIVVHASNGLAGAGTFMTAPLSGNKVQRHAGKASFAFVAPSGSDRRASTGAAALAFNVGGLSFRSTDMMPVAVTAGRARFEGSGAINGSGTYSFSLVTSASGKGETARFGLKIWHRDATSGRDVVDYDNQQSGAGIGAGFAGNALSEGSIVLQ